MIVISTSTDGTRHYRVPAALRDVAVALFPDSDDVGAIFQLARRLLCADFATTENLALEDGHEEAVRFARERLVERPRWRQ